MDNCLDWSDIDRSLTKYYDPAIKTFTKQLVELSKIVMQRNHKDNLSQYLRLFRNTHRNKSWYIDSFIQNNTIICYINNHNVNPDAISFSVKFIKV